jgi:cell division protein FtsQ
MSKLVAKTKKPTRSRKKRLLPVRLALFLWKIVKVPEVAVSLFITLSVVWFYFSGNYAAAKQHVIVANGYLSEKTGMVLKDILLEGQEYTPKEDIIRIMTNATIEDDAHLTIGDPILNIDLQKIKQKLEKLTWVRYASVERLYPSTLSVSIIERKPFALWQDNGIVNLIDSEGDIIKTRDIAKFSNLIIMVGDEAPAQAESLFNLINTEPELAKRVSSVIRVGKRRWNIRLSNEVEIKLPEEDATKAWKQVAQMQKETSILENDIKTIDLRIGDENKVFIK